MPKYYKGSVKNLLFLDRLSFLFLDAERLFHKTA